MKKNVFIKTILLLMVIIIIPTIIAGITGVYLFENDITQEKYKELESDVINKTNFLKHIFKFTSQDDFNILAKGLVSEVHDDFPVTYIITDNSGIVIFSSNEDFTGKKFTALNGIIKNSNTKNTSPGNNLNESSVGVAYSYFEQKGWYICASVNHSSFLFPVVRLKQILYIITAMMSALTVIFAAIYSRRLTIENEEKRKLIFESNPQMAMIWSSDYKVLDMNPAAYDFYDVSSVEEFNEKYSDGLPIYLPDGEQPSGLFGNIFQTTIDKGSSGFECVQISKGRKVPINVITKSIEHCNEFVVITYNYDLSSLKEAQKTLVERDNLLESLNLIAGMLLSPFAEDQDGIINKVLNIFGDSVKCDRVRIFKHIDDDNQLPSLLYSWLSDEKYSKSSDDPGIEYKDLFENCQNILKAGKTINVMSNNIPENIKYLSSYFKDKFSILLTPIFIKDNYWGFMSIAKFNVGYRYTEIEENMLITASNLIVSGLLRNEITSELIKAKEAALAGTNAKSEFLSRMSHEIRTPMNAIIGMTNIASDSKDLGKIQDCLGKINIASTQLLDIINDVLDMSKIEANKFELESNNFSLRNTIDKVVSVNTVKINEKHQQLTIEYDDKIPNIILGDEIRISQILTNLISNSIKFTPFEGEIKIITKLLSLNYDTAEIKFAVSDTGIGIPIDKQSILFNLFEQGDGGTSRKYGGTGLGLAITKKFVELMNGNIWLESIPGEGSTFAFIIPFKYQEQELTSNSDIDVENKNVLSESRKVFPGKKMLLAEDVEINIEILEALLHESLIEIDSVNNGREAVDKFIANPEKYDIIFMDIQMPIMDGYEATRHIRRLAPGIEHAETIPIVAMTANAFKEDIEKCLAAGMNSHCSKPVNIEEVLAALNTYL